MFVNDFLQDFWISNAAPISTHLQIRNHQTLFREKLTTSNDLHSDEAEK